MRKILSRSLFGLLFIAIGVGYLGNTLGFWEGFSIFFDGWWAIAFIVLPAVFFIILDGFHVGNLLLLLVGVLLYLSQIEIISGVSLWEILLCSLAILIGISIIFKPAFSKRKSNKDHTFVDSGKTDEKQSVVFGSERFDFSGRSFSGGEFSVSFGEITIDLRGAILEHDCQLIIHVAFGSLNLLLPDNVGLVNESGSFFGGVDIHRRGAVDPNYPKIILSGNCAFGGVEVK